MAKYPLIFISMGYKSIKLVIKSNKVYRVYSGDVEHMYFLRLNQIYNPNNTMGVVEISDKLIGTYRTDHWILNRN